MSERTVYVCDWCHRKVVSIEAHDNWIRFCLPNHIIIAYGGKGKADDMLEGPLDFCDVDCMRAFIREMSEEAKSNAD